MGDYNILIIKMGKSLGQYNPNRDLINDLVIYDIINHHL